MELREGNKSYWKFENDRTKTDDALRELCSVDNVFMRALTFMQRPIRRLPSVREIAAALLSIKYKQIQFHTVWLDHEQNHQL
jgi:hypothetical protein